MNVTPENVGSILSAIGCVPYVQTVAQGWRRVFIHVPQEDGIPLSVGRVMFHNGKFSHVKWYSGPESGDLQDHHLYCFRWNFYISTGVVMLDDMWDLFRKEAKELSLKLYQQRVDARAELNRIKPKKRRKLWPANQCSAAQKIFEQWVEEKVLG